jgi:hypothetical protein
MSHCHIGTHVEENKQQQANLEDQQSDHFKTYIISYAYISVGAHQWIIYWIPISILFYQEAHGPLI